MQQGTLGSEDVPEVGTGTGLGDSWDGRREFGGSRWRRRWCRRRRRGRCGQRRQRGAEVRVREVGLHVRVLIRIVRRAKSMHVNWGTKF